MVDVTSGQVYSVTSPPTVSGTRVLSGGAMTIEDKGQAINTTVFGGGQLSLLNGGFAGTTVISAGGTLLVSGREEFRPYPDRNRDGDIGYSYGSVIYGAGIVGKGGLAFRTTLHGGGTLTVTSAGFVESVIVLSGSRLTVRGTVYEALVSSGGVETVESGGYDTGRMDFSFIYAGGLQVLRGAGTQAVVTGVAGVQSVTSGALARDADILSGGLQMVDAGGLSFQTGVHGETRVAGSSTAAIVYSGGLLTVVDGGFSSKTTIYAGGSTVVQSGGKSFDAFIDGYVIDEVYSFGTEAVLSGGLARASLVSGGLQVVSSGGVAEATTVTGRKYFSDVPDTVGTMTISAGGVANAPVVSVSGVVSNAGLTSGTRLLGGREIVTGGGVASAAVVRGGGVLSVGAGGVARDTTITSGGAAKIVSGGVASGTTVSAGGQDYIFSGGIDRATTLLAGGTQTVFGGGVASNTVISSGGTEFVAAGGIDRFSVISSGGLEFVSSGSLISGTTIVSGGKLMVASGGTVRAGILLVSGGTAIISGGVTPGQFVNMAGAGNEIALYQVVNFGATIVSFSAGDLIDLGGFGYGPSATRSFVEAPSNTSGTLTVSAGGHTAHLTLAGSYATSNFALATDGAGGTLVKYA